MQGAQDAQQDAQGSRLSTSTGGRHSPARPAACALAALAWHGWDGSSSRGDTAESSREVALAIPSSRRSSRRSPTRAEVGEGAVGGVPASHGVPPRMARPSKMLLDLPTAPPAGCSFLPQHNPPAPASSGQRHLNPTALERQQQQPRPFTPKVGGSPVLPRSGLAAEQRSPSPSRKSPGAAATSPPGAAASSGARVGGSPPRRGAGWLDAEQGAGAAVHSGAGAGVGAGAGAGGCVPAERPPWCAGMMRVPTPTTPDDELRRGDQRATLDPSGASRPSSALVEQHWWPQRAAAGGVGEVDGEIGGAEERASMAAAASHRSAVARHQPLAVRSSLPLAAAESCSPRPCAPAPLCPGLSGGGGGLSAAEVLDEMASSWPPSAPPLLVHPPGGPLGLSGSQPALRDGPARSLQPLPSTAEATATAPGALLPVSSPQRLPPRSAQPVGLKTSQSVGALGVGGSSPPCRRPRRARQCCAAAARQPRTFPAASARLRRARPR